MFGTFDMTKHSPHVERLARIALFAAFPLLFCGCKLGQKPFTDELADQRSVTTPSVDAVRAASVQPSAFETHGEAKTLPMTDGSVTHGPLYFEDPYEDTGSNDGKFAWSGEDYLWMFYWRGRYLVNAVAFPVSAVVSPPWTVMVSDGSPSPRAFGEQHDAVRQEDPVATAEPVPEATDGS